MSPTPLLANQPSFWMPVQASENAAATDTLFHFIFYVSAFFFALIMVLMIWFVVRYRRRAPEEAGTGPHHNTALEVLWSVVPIGLVVAMFLIGFKDYMRMVGPQNAPNAYEIGVLGVKWKWTFTYPNGYVDDALHVPVDTPMQLTLSSDDVIHSLYIPAFRIKQDAVPGRYTKMFFRAIEPGEYQIFCAEYCGTSHSTMLTKVVVHRPGEYEKWLEQASNFLDRMSPAEGGQKLFMQRGCATCHSVDGKAGTGPTLKGVFGHDVILTTGAKVVADENYVRESILNPQAKVVAGFEPVMPTFQGRLKDREITAIIEYLKTVQ
jgi:cytochrome c oxidase subunit 2